MKNAMRKVRNLFLFLTFWGCALCASAQGFIHPGILHTQADFDRVKEKLAAKEEPWTSAFEQLMTSPHVDLNWNPSPTRKIIRGGGNREEPEGDNYGVAYRDAATAYQCALVWRITGDEAYARKSVQILNAWARVCKAVTGNSNSNLAAGLYGYEFANAGELMRDYEGWNRTDFKAFQTWMMNVFANKSFIFLDGRKAPGEDHYWSNWGLCNVMCVLSVAILCDDVYLYNAGYEFYKYKEDHDYAESLKRLIWRNFEDERGPFGYLGQMQESNRDQGHATMAAILASDVCAVGRNQGEDAYMQQNDLIAGGFEYVAAYNAGVDDLPNVPYVGSTHGTFVGMGAGGRGNGRPGWPRIVNYYENVRGVKVPYAREMMMKSYDGIDGGGGFYGGNSGGYDHLGFTTLMCSLDPLEDPEAVPTVLGGTLQYDGVSTTRTEVSNIPRGATVKILVTLPDGEEDTGRWSWDDDPSCTSNEREIVLDTTSIYRVRYVNAHGVECTRMYSLQVEGEGYAWPFEPYCKMGLSETSDTLIYVEKNEGVTFGLKPMYFETNVREWTWERSTDGEKWTRLTTSTGLMELPAVTSNAYYRVTLTYRSGVKISQNFRVEIAEITPYIIYNGEETSGLSLALQKGESFSLTAEPTSILGTAANSTRIYKWVVNGDTIQADTLTTRTDSWGNKVADLSDTLHVENLDSCFDCTLVFRRIAYSGAEASTVYHFSIPVYEVNTLEPEDTDSFYVTDAATGNYLRNTDGRFMPYSEEEDASYLWRIRRLPSNYGNRYMFISRSNSNQHLSETGALTTTTDYSRHSFNLWHKVSNEYLYAIERSSGASGGLFAITDDAITVDGSGICTSFPFQIVRKTSSGEENPDGVEEAVADVQTGNGLIRCTGSGAALTLTAAENGLLKVYDFTGRLCLTQRCLQGANSLSLPASHTGWVLLYVGDSGQVQSLKVK